ncbi:hypothetical protein AJ78_07955 [Emergomyces pasteurianus Ep9510]|uniref:Uncharacterized protein n=1 Tax=Emergomyces pasteurianus Ep9510 TaxID=1447872 RepID=A0A1J9P4E1_9EURO|nr:hypothetical protein AJ78_07955 [Emergomyces pasteurianus Ep9510]
MLHRSVALLENGLVIHVGLYADIALRARKKFAPAAAAKRRAYYYTKLPFRPTQLFYLVTYIALLSPASNQNNLLSLVMGCFPFLPSLDKAIAMLKDLVDCGTSTQSMAGENYAQLDEIRTSTARLEVAPLPRINAVNSVYYPNTPMKVKEAIFTVSYERGPRRELRHDELIACSDGNVALQRWQRQRGSEL